jgi:hypothetical protein
MGKMKKHKINDKISGAEKRIHKVALQHNNRKNDLMTSKP